jgi:hypothetical protein
VGIIQATVRGRAAPLVVEYLVVAAGGSGGNDTGGGGGAGGLLSGSLPNLVRGNSNTVTVGTGAVNSNGGNSVFASITSTGGGMGGNGFVAGSNGG